MADALVTSLVEALLGSGPEGRRFDEQVLRDAVPVLLLSISDSVDVRAVPAALARMVESFLARAGATDPAQAPEAIARYLEAHPLPKELWATVQAVLREHSRALSPEALGRVEAFARFSAEERRLPDPKASAPEGSVKSGPLARTKLLARKEDE